jgi:proton-dependent oligopeptide transporter, POT family
MEALIREPAATVRESTDVLGHPRGLAYLVFAETWERFSYYGMQALLVLYMGQQLLLPGHVERVVGFAAFRSWIEHVYGPLSPAALASVIFGLYAGGVYLTPLAGGFIADRFLGRTVTVTVGAVLMVAGHLLMAFEIAFLLALTCLLLGVGCFKGNIASQVGEMYGPGDLRRADAFQIYYLGINVAVIVSPLVCGTLGQKVAWHWGFGAAGVGMLIGLAVYLSGRRWLPASKPRARVGGRRPLELSRSDWSKILVLVALLPVLALSELGNQQIYNTYLVWGDAQYARTFFGFEAPVTWLLSVDAFIALSMILLVVAFWRMWSRKRREPDEIVKLAIGAAISALAPLLLVLGSLQGTAAGQKVSLAWGLGFHLVNSVGYALLFPVGLALYSRASPRAITGLMIGVFYLHLFLANMTVGRLGGLLETLGDVPFWLLHSGLMAAGCALLVLFAVAFRPILAPTTEARE